MKELYHKIFKVRNGHGKPYDYHPLCLYRTSWGYPLINLTARRVEPERNRYILVNKNMNERDLVRKACEDWLRLHMFEDENMSVDYQAVLLAVKNLDGKVPE